MKKLFFVVLMALLCTTLFAERYYLIGLGGLFQTMSGEIDYGGTNGNFTTVSPGVGLDSYYYSDVTKWGLRTSLAFYFPVAGEIEIGNTTFDFSNNEIKSSFGMNTFIAASYFVQTTEKFLLPISAGLHYNLFTFEVEVSRFIYPLFFKYSLDYMNINFGIGCSI